MTSNPSTWSFVWTSIPVGPFRRETEGWLLEGRPYTYPEKGWVVAHDVFHHAPGDRGTYAEEVCTFGAELWMDSHSPLSDMSMKISDSWAGVMSMVLENGSRGVKGLLLNTTPNTALLRHDFASFFRETYKKALANTQNAFIEFSEDPAWNQAATVEAIDRAVCLAVEGYEWAAKRWPNVSQATAWFKQLEAMAEEKGEPGETLLVSIQNGEMRIERTVPTIAPETVARRRRVKMKPA